jgi:hypothetical protein
LAGDQAENLLRQEGLRLVDPAANLFSCSARTGLLSAPGWLKSYITEHRSFYSANRYLEFEGMGSTTTISFGGMTINPLWDATALAAPAIFRATNLQKPFPTQRME